MFHGYSRLTPGVGLDGGDIIKLNLAYNKELERVVVAERGMRSVLKEYVYLIGPASKNLMYLVADQPTARKVSSPTMC